MMLGRVDDVDGHYIATKFVAAAIPTESVYVTPMAARASQVTSAAPLKVKTDWRSIGLGWARVWLPVFAITSPVLQLILFHTVNVITIISSLLVGACAVAAFRAGKLPEAEKARLRLLGTVTGLRVDPSRLPDAFRATKRDTLGDLMEKGGIPMTPAEILSVIDDIPVPAMPLVYGYACYAGDDLEWRECAELIYQRHEQSEV
jgi:hypothetical protein